MLSDKSRYSSIRKPTISVFGLSHELARALEPVKQSLEIITGSRAGMSELKGLSPDADTRAIVKKINEICERLNASGKC